MVVSSLTTTLGVIASLPSGVGEGDAEPYASLGEYFTDDNAANTLLVLAYIEFMAFPDLVKKKCCLVVEFHKLINVLGVRMRTTIAARETSSIMLLARTLPRVGCSTM